MLDQESPMQLPTYMRPTSTARPVKKRKKGQEEDEGATKTEADGSMYVYKKRTTGLCQEEWGWHMIKGPDTPKDLMKKLQANPSPAPISGNLYEYFAFGMSETYSKSVSLMLVAFIQILAPVVILCWAVFQLQWHLITSKTWTSGAFFDIQYGSAKKNLTGFMTRLLGMAFLFCFIMSGRECLKNDRANWEKIMKLLSFLEEQHMSHSVVKWYWLAMGPAINTYLIVLLSVDMLFLLLLAGGPKDVAFDALGLLFLWNLDDVGGNLGFMSDQDWNGANLAAYYEKYVIHEWYEAEDEAKSDSNEEDDPEQETDTNCWHSIGEWIYCTGDVLLGASVFLLPALYFFLSGLDLKKPGN